MSQGKKLKVSNRVLFKYYGKKNVHFVTKEIITRLKLKFSNPHILAI